MDRISIYDVKDEAEKVNYFLREIGMEIHVGQRYGYVGLDLYDLQTGQVLDTLKTGLTRREAYNYLEAMRKALSLYTGETVYRYR